MKGAALHAGGRVALRARSPSSLRWARSLCLAAALATPMRAMGEEPPAAPTQEPPKASRAPATAATPPRPARPNKNAAAAAAASEPTGRDIWLRDLGYTGNITAKGIFPTQTFRFPKPEGITTLGPGSMLKMRVQHSSALLPESTLTILVDDVPVFSRLLNVPHEAWFDVEVPLADLRLREDQPYVQVELRFFNVVGANPCDDLSNPAI